MAGPIIAVPIVAAPIAASMVSGAQAAATSPAVHVASPPALHVAAPAVHVGSPAVHVAPPPPPLHPAPQPQPPPAAAAAASNSTHSTTQVSVPVFPNPWETPANESGCSMASGIDEYIPECHWRGCLVKTPHRCCRPWPILYLPRQQRTSLAVCPSGVALCDGTSGKDENSRCHWRLMPS